MLLSIASAEPDPKKYKPEVKPKEKQTNTSLTDDERKFLREVEAKFGIKPDVPVETLKENEEEGEESPKVPFKAPFPAVIAIEIVNDTDSKSKGKRTIDANLGYGYRTNNGYTYTYLGKPTQEKGKFMIYPYSQEDIPPARPESHYSGYSHNTKISPNVEITPSQAYELVPAKEDEQTAYHYDKPAVEFKTKYENVQGLQTPPPPYPSTSHQATPHTLYTTYNGEQFSGLSGQFPKVMQNYFVDSSQLLNNPQYQSAGLTQDHLRTHGANLEQRVVPVLVLRVPSSYLKNPSAELYANLPQNYPLSQYLNGVNLQEMVNQYFKKIGYTHAPQLMTYQSPVVPVPAPVAAPAPASYPSYEPQQYASPYVRPSYTHADYSGVQYSAVQPVMAKYPSSYTRQQYYMTRGQPLYQQPLQQQQYTYRYRYVPQMAVQQQSYYVQPQYQHNSYQVVSQEPQNKPAADDQETSLHDASGHAEYDAHQQSHSEESDASYEEYETPQDQTNTEHDHAQQSTPNYGTVTTAAPVEYEHSNDDSSSEYGQTQVPLSGHDHSHSVQVQYETPANTDTVAVFSRGQTGHNSLHYSPPQTTQYIYHQKLVNENSASDTLVLHENYPSKDHTIATVLPLSYKRQQSPEPVQSVSYVTPMPTMKFHSQYRVMVPQTVLRRPTNEKVSYVNSHSVPSSSYSHGGSKEFNPEQEYTTGSHYIPPIGKQKPPSYPRNYHSSLKRMAKPESKSDTAGSMVKKIIEKNDRKKSS